MVKKSDDFSAVKIYSNYVIGIIALVLSIMNPLPGLILGIVGLVRIGKNKDAISRKAKVLNVVAIIIGVILAAVSVTLTLLNIDWSALASA